MRAYEFALEDLPTRRVDAARLSVYTQFLAGEAIGSVLLVLDADRDEFVRVPVDPLAHGGIQALGHDGRRLVLGSRGGGVLGHGRVGLFTLASGDLRWLAAGPDGPDHVASLSPDSRHIAVLNFADYPESTWADDPEPVAIDVIEVATGERHRAWVGPRGGWGAESALRWSPDGAFIALAFYQWMEEREDTYWATAVIDTAGNIHGHYLDDTIPRSNSAWLDEHRLLLSGGRDDWNHRIVDITTGTQHIVGPADQIPMAVIGDRIVVHALGTAGDPARLVTTAFDGSDPRPFITIRDTGQVFGLDIATSMWA